MRKLLLLTLIFVTNIALSQSFYEIKWSSDEVDYTALVEFFHTENIKVRVKYTINGDYRVAKYDAVAIYDQSNDFYMIMGSNARIVYPYNFSNPTGYSPDNFCFLNRGGYDNTYQDLFTFDSNDVSYDGSVNDLKEATYRVLDPYTDFTEQYIYNFFERHEPEYIAYTALIAGNNYSYDSTPSYTSSNSSSNTGYSENFDKIYFTNACTYTTKLVIRYQDLNDEWVTKGWYSLEPGENAYIADTKNTNIYFYAEDATGSWSGDTYLTFNGEQYGFIEWKITDPDWGIQTKRLTCDEDSIPQETTPSYETLSDVKVHLIFAADVDDPEIGHSTEEDMNDITNLFKKVSKELEVEFESHKLYGNYFDKNSINATIDNLSINNNDVIIFYYSGHGYNNTNTYNKFPNMSLDGPDLSLETIHNRLKNKNARLTLTIGDLCNSIPQMRRRAGNETEIPFKNGFLFDYNKLTKLFIDTSGDLISTSSQKGQWSYSMGNGSNGHFTNAFIDAFTEEASKVSGQSGNWTSLFSNAYREAKNKTGSIRNQDGSFGQSGTNTNNLRY